MSEDRNIFLQWKTTCIAANDCSCLQGAGKKIRRARSSVLFHNQEVQLPVKTLIDDCFLLTTG